MEKYVYQFCIHRLMIHKVANSLQNAGIQRRTLGNGNTAREIYMRRQSTMVIIECVFLHQSHELSLAALYMHLKNVALQDSITKYYIAVK